MLQGFANFPVRQAIPESQEVEKPKYSQAPFQRFTIACRHSNLSNFGENKPQV